MVGVTLNNNGCGCWSQLSQPQDITADVLQGVPKVQAFLAASSMNAHLSRQT